MEDVQPRAAGSASGSAGGLGRRGLVLGGVLAAETLDAAGGVDDPLLAGEERVAIGADFDVIVLARGRAGLVDGVAAHAGDLDRAIVRMDAALHGSLLVVRRHDRVSAGRSRVLPDPSAAAGLLLLVHRLQALLVGLGLVHLVEEEL